MDFPQKIPLSSDIYNQDSIEISRINLFFGVNGSGKSLTLKQINKHFRNSLIMDENRVFTPDIQATMISAPQIGYFTNYNNLSLPSVISEINEIFHKLFPDRKISNSSNIGSNISPISIEKNGKNFAVGADGRGIWNVIKPLEALVLCNDSNGIIIEEFSLGLYPGIINQYYELVKEKILKKNSFLVTTTQDPFVVYQFLKNKINQDLSWEDKELDVSVFKFSEDENGKINIMKIDENTQPNTINELMNDYAEGIDMIKFSAIFSKPDETTSN